MHAYKSLEDNASSRFFEECEGSGAAITFSPSLLALHLLGPGSSKPD